MPRFYEEAAHLLLVMIAQGVALAPGADLAQILQAIASMLDRCIKTRPTHADAANGILALAAAHGMSAIVARDRERMIALIGTLIGNMMTMHCQK